MRFVWKAVAAALALSAGAVLAQTKQLKWAHVYETSEPYHTESVWAAGEIKKRTNGKFDIQVFPPSSLGKETDINQGLALGTVDMIISGPSFAARSYPRIGIAYRPWGAATVFRAGWGVFYNVVPFVYSLEFGGLPFVLREPSYTNSSTNPQVIFPRVFPATGTGGPSTVGIPAAENPDYRTPYSMQYNFTIERQQWNTGFRASYIGTAMRRGVYQYNYNAPAASTSNPTPKPSRRFSPSPARSRPSISRRTTRRSRRSRPS